VFCTLQVLKFEGSGLDGGASSGAVGFNLFDFNYCNQFEVKSEKAISLHRKHIEILLVDHWFR
jgi:hypothetical protein